MPMTHGVGPFFFHTVNLRPKTPFIHRANTNEIEPPYRWSYSRIIKIWPGKGIVLGRWINLGRTEKEGLLAATAGHEKAMSTDDIRDRTRRFDQDADDALLT
ncbi:hypothetical protein PV336_16515 [Streptomyces sp. MI02-2A]|uniref:hypothetical protein n=1 Tax=Streptomyces sp. MI02-2A TaxID=3028688 RepID=UPI0029ACA007|nr:hypothetical protein [Streptomyces sp. MI02-2A]MDX3260822.1 hypothetical protein [Streptomyces sp. MI02-2A]